MVLEVVPRARLERVALRLAVDQTEQRLVLEGGEQREARVGVAVHADVQRARHGGAEVRAEVRDAEDLVAATRRGEGVVGGGGARGVEGSVDVGVAAEDCERDLVGARPRAGARAGRRG